MQYETLCKWLGVLTSFSLGFHGNTRFPRVYTQCWQLCSKLCHPRDRVYWVGPQRMRVRKKRGRRMELRKKWSPLEFERGLVLQILISIKRDCDRTHYWLKKRKKCEYIGRQLRNSLFAFIGPPSKPNPSCQKWEPLRCLAPAVPVASAPGGPTGLQRLISSNFPDSQFLFTAVCILLCLWEELLQLCTAFHCVHSVHSKWFTNRHNTNKITVPLLCISLLISGGGRLSIR